MFHFSSIPSTGSFPAVCAGCARMRKRLFYGWYVVAVAFMANFMATGSGFYIFNALMNPLCDDRGWTRTELNGAPAIGLVLGILTTPLLGTLVVRLGPRLLMTAGALVSGFSFCWMGAAATIGHFYVLFALVAFGNAAMGGIVANTAVSNWFERKRGRALGLATAGISLSGAVLPYLGMKILEWTSLASVFVWVGAWILAVSPVAWLVVRDRPESMGLSPDGGSDSKAASDGGAAIPPGCPAEEAASVGFVLAQNRGAPCPWSPSRAIRTGAFWKVGFAYALVMMGVAGVMFQLAPRFIDLGYDRRTAMLLTSAAALAGTVGKAAWGILCDWFDPRRVAAALMAMNALGLGLALLPGSPVAVALFVGIFGFAMGGVMSTFPILVADLFGRDSFAQVARFLGLLLFLNGAGYLVMGQSFDRTGTYDAAYGLFVVLDLAAAALILSVKRP